jgi:hypothetical protein
MALPLLVALFCGALALGGFFVVWMLQRRLKTRIDALEQMHGQSERLISGIEVGPQEVAFPRAKYIVLGSRQLRIFMDNQSEPVFPQAQKDVTIELPRRTTHVFPAMQGFMIMYGEIVDPDSNGQVRFLLRDNHLGVAYAKVNVLDVGDTTATIRASMLLADVHFDKPWTGFVDASVLFMERVEVF